MRAPDTWYHRTARPAAPRPSLTGRARSAVAIVGGGLAGLSTALELARRGMAVTLCEAESLGFGASGRNGGFVSDGFAAGDAAIARRAGRDGAMVLQALSREGREAVRANIAEFGLTGAALTPGILRMRRHEPGDDLKEEATGDPELDYLGPDAIGEFLTTARYRHGQRDRGAFHIHPLNYLRGLADAVEAMGGRIHEATPVTGLAGAPGGFELTTPAGTLRAQTVVVTTGGYTGPLVPELRRAMLPIATYVMQSETAPALLSRAIRTYEAVGDDRRAGDYYRLVEGGARLLWGGRITTRAASTAGIVRELRHEMTTVYPDLAGLKTEHAWSGLMAYARHQMPQIGQLRPGLWYATAFGGHGLNTTAIAGRLLAEAIAGESDRTRAFEPFGLDWTGGPAGLVAAQLIYWSLQAQDRWREARAGALRQ